MLLFVLGKVLLVSEKDITLPTAVARARRDSLHLPLFDTPKMHPTSSIRTVYTEVLLRHIFFHIHRLNWSRLVPQTRQVGAVELDYASLRVRNETLAAPL